MFSNLVVGAVGVNPWNGSVFLGRAVVIVGWLCHWMVLGACCCIISLDCCVVQNKYALRLACRATRNKRINQWMDESVLTSFFFLAWCFCSSSVRWRCCSAFVRNRLVFYLCIPVSHLCFFLLSHGARLYVVVRLVCFSLLFCLCPFASAITCLALLLRARFGGCCFITSHNNK